MLDAPREEVFELATDPEWFPDFWGPEGLKTVVDKMDVRSGGQWRAVQTDQDGKEYAFHGIYHTVRAPDLVIQTLEWEGMPDHVTMDTTKYEEVDGRTKITTVSAFQNVDDRDGMYRMGMVEGTVATMDRMARILKKGRRR